MQTCHFDLTQNLNKCEKKSKYKETNLNLTTEIEFLYCTKNLNLESGYLNFTKFQKKKSE